MSPGEITLRPVPESVRHTLLSLAHVSTTWHVHNTRRVNASRPNMRAQTCLWLGVGWPHELIQAHRSVEASKAASQYAHPWSPPGCRPCTATAHDTEPKSEQSNGCAALASTHAHLPNSLNIPMCVSHSEFWVVDAHVAAWASCPGKSEWMIRTVTCSAVLCRVSSGSV